MSVYRDGLNVMVGAETDKAIFIKVHNATQLADKQGGMASLASKLAPATVEGKVYDEMAKKLAASLKDAGVDASVDVINAPGGAPAKPADSTLKNALIGAVVVGLGFLGYRYVNKKHPHAETV